MRNSLIIWLVASLLLCSHTGHAQSVQRKATLPSYVFPQAVPVYNLLKSLEVSDFNLYQSVWSSETLKMYRKGEHKDNWGKIHVDFIKVFREELGDYCLEKLRYSFEEGNVIP